MGIYPINGGDPRILESAESMVPVAWTQDGQWLFAYSKTQSVPLPVFRVNVQTGHAELWKQVAPADREGIAMLAHVLVAQDGKSYYYSHHRNLSELFIVDGWDHK